MKKIFFELFSLIRPIAATLVFLVSMAVPIFIFGQCNNEDFETGTATGWFGFTGFINSNGHVHTDDSGLVDGRHTITTGDGLDPIGASCGIDLPVVESSGLHSLQLGNVMTGAQAERITQTFTVEPGREFFLYKYAVVLEDPSHQSHQQPRFEVRVFDANGDLIPCGSYSVRAGPNAADDGFVLCNAAVNPNYPSYTRQYWIKDWTIAGADLSGYVGQQVTIEFLTTDCTLGGHAGYAYVESSCKSLDIAVDGLCPGSDTTRLSVTEGFESYEWYDGSTGNSISVADLQFGDTVSVTVNSFTGCSTTIQKILGPVDSVAIQPIPDTEVCRGSGAVLEASGSNVGYFYWPELDETSNSVVIFPDTASVLHYEAYDLNGCPTGLADSVLITLRGFDLDTLVQGVSCQGLNDGQITILPQGGISPFQYEWSSEGNTATIDSLFPGVYTVTVTDEQGNGCSRDLELVLEEPSGVDVLTNSVESQCLANNGMAWVTAEGGSGSYTFNWSNGSTTDTIFNLPAGTYQVTITELGGAGCVQRSEVTVTEPPVFLTTQVVQPRCFPDDGSALVIPEGGSSPNFFYQWGPTRETTPGISNLSAGTYWVEVTDENGCTASDTITLRPPPDPLSIQPFAEAAVCSFFDGAASVTVMGGLSPYFFEWSSGQQQASIDSLSPVTYEILVVDANDCEISGSTVVDPPPPLLDIFLETEDAICTFDDGAANVTIEGGTPPFNIEWSGSSDSGTAVDQLSVGEQAVTITDSNGCVESETGFVGPPPPPPSFSYTATGESYNLQNGIAHLEIIGGTPPFTTNWLHNGEGGFSAYGLAAGEYSIQVTDGNGCLHYTEVSVPEIPPIKTYNAFTPNGDGFNDAWQIEDIIHYPNCEVRIYNRWGNLVFESKGYNFPWQGFQGTTGYPADTYYYIIDLKIGIQPFTGYVDLIK